MAEVRVQLVNWPEHAARLREAGLYGQVIIHQAAADIAGELKKTAVEESPIGKTTRSGPRFRDSWLTQIDDAEGAVVITLGNTAPHAVFVVDPTRPHVITARHQTRGGRPGFLRFEAGGQTLFRHSVNHPGTPGNPVHERVNQRLLPRYQQIVEQRTGDLAAKIASAFS